MIFTETYDVGYVRTVMEFVELCKTHSNKQIIRVGLDSERNEFAMIFKNKEVIIKTTNLEKPEEPTPPILIITKPKKDVEKKINKHGDLKIPFTPKTDNKAYQRAWALCKAYGFVTYPEALKLKEAKRSKVSSTIEPTPPISLNSIPEEPDKLPDGISPGIIIKYIRGRGKFLRCTGMVKRTNPTSGEILVQFDKGLEWVDAKHCDIVPIKKVE
jgi:hypothetical protein